MVGKNMIFHKHLLVNAKVKNPINTEQAGIDFLTDLHGHTLWKQTSYNGNIRKNYAGIGYTYDVANDWFYAPQPYPSWTLDADAKWQPPVPYPTDGKMYTWNETTLSWDEVVA